MFCLSVASSELMFSMPPSCEEGGGGGSGGGGGAGLSSGGSGGRDEGLVSDCLAGARLRLAFSANTGSNDGFMEIPESTLEGV